jgi:hypothetical protein
MMQRDEMVTSPFLEIEFSSIILRKWEKEHLFEKSWLDWNLKDECERIWNYLAWKVNEYNHRLIRKETWEHKAFEKGATEKSESYSTKEIKGAKLFHKWNESRSARKIKKMK